VATSDSEGMRGGSLRGKKPPVSLQLSELLLQQGITDRSWEWGEATVLLMVLIIHLGSWLLAEQVDTD